MIKIKETNKAFRDTLSILKQYSTIDIFRDLYNDVQAKSARWDFYCLLRHHGINICFNSIHDTDFVRVDSFMAIISWGPGRTISWPDDGLQPENELLLKLAFSSGPYIFGSSSDNDYPREFFQSFWKELCQYNPDYRDTVNSSLYWKIGNAKDIFNGFPAILKKYRGMNAKDCRLRRIERLKDELSELEEK